MTEEALEPRHHARRSRRCRRSRAFAAAGRHAGREAEPLPLAVHFGEEREHPFSGVAQQGCENLGRCDIGCPVTPRTRSTSPTSPAPSSTAPRCGRCTWSTAHRAARSQGGLARALPAPRRRRRRQRRGAAGRARGRDARLAPAAAHQPQGACRASRPRWARRFSGNGDALGVAFDPRRPTCAAPATTTGPSMTSRLDYTADRNLMVADGGLPAGLRRAARHRPRRQRHPRLAALAAAAARPGSCTSGWSDQSLRPREVRPARRAAPTPTR